MNGRTTLKQIKELANSIDPRDYNYQHIGVRVQDAPHGATVGKALKHRSNVWDDGEMTSEKLDGVSAINVPWDSMYRPDFDDSNCAYIGETILVLGSDYADEGNDPDEIVMRNPIVIDIKRIGE